MKVAIVEDDIVFSEKLKSQLDAFLSSILTSYTINVINSNYRQQVITNEYDLLFLDIDLKETSGIDIGNILRNKGNISTIIFISLREELVFSSLTARPFYFVRKANYDEDMKILFSLLRQHFKTTLQLYTFEFKGRKTSLFLKDISIIESRSHQIILHTKDGEYMYRSTMKKMLQSLPSKGFVQIQKSYAINLDYVQEIDKSTITLRDGQIYNLGRKFKDDVFLKYKENLIK